jgi:hypothetical protein
MSTKCLFGFHLVHGLDVAYGVFWCVRCKKVVLTRGV